MIIVISNNGNSTATNFDIEPLFKTNANWKHNCEIAILAPNNKTCVFDMLCTVTTSDKHLSFVINNNTDSYTPDNTIIEEGAMLR